MKHAFTIDALDRQLLYALDRDSRATLNELGKSVRRSANAVHHRLKLLTAAGVIKHFHTIIDAAKLGYTGWRLYVKLHGATPQEEAELLAFLKDQPAVTWLVSIAGEYDIGCFVQTRRNAEMSALWAAMQERFTHIILRTQLAVTSRIRYFPRAYLAGKEVNHDECGFAGDADANLVDEVDERLLRVLAENSRASAVELAHAARIGAVTAVAHIKALERTGVITGYRVAVDLDALGYEYVKVSVDLADADLRTIHALRTWCLEHPNVTYETQSLGGDDLEFELQVRDQGELRAILESLRGRFGRAIADMRTMTFYAEHKYQVLPPPA